MSKARLTKELNVYRGMYTMDANSPLLQIKPGDVFADKAFLSTTLSRHAAAHFFDPLTHAPPGYTIYPGDPYETQILWKIHAPVGSKAGLISHVHMWTEGERAKGESEVLFDRNTRLKVNSVKKTKGGMFRNKVRYEISAEVLV